MGRRATALLGCGKTEGSIRRDVVRRIKLGGLPQMPRPGEPIGGQAGQARFKFFKNPGGDLLQRRLFQPRNIIENGMIEGRNFLIDNLFD